VTAHFLAFDLGAESGRAMLGTLEGGVLGVREIHRFANEPVRQNGSLLADHVTLNDPVTAAFIQVIVSAVDTSLRVRPTTGPSCAADTPRTRTE
jgi:sugar (pentulose or hexulose) kinase